MSALLSAALDDVAPIRHAPYGPQAEGGTVVPLIQRAPGRVMETAARAPREPMVRRTALFERLAEARPVTLISGPAASGKTCLVRTWIAAAGLDAHTAWTTVAGDLGTASGPGGDGVVERLTARLQGREQPTLLVIDDLQELKSAAAQAQLEQFLTWLPAQLRVVLLTRAATGLGLHRLRLAGDLTELRGGDLRFTRDETRELLDAAGIPLSDDGVTALQDRSEGWVGALRLAVAALADHPEPERFAREFSGSERTVAGYLRAEVLERQPPEVRDLLLRTSVLDRVSGPLADALTGGSGSLRVLHELDDSGAFVTAIDVGRSWFRYHPLLADVLRLELRRLNPALVATLHRAAGEWHERHGDVVDAVRHAQAAGDWPHAASLLAANHLTLILDGRVAAVRERLRAFPGHAASADPELALVYATADAADGLYAESAAQIAAAEQLACGLPEERRSRFELGVAGTKLWLARLRGDAERAAETFHAAEAALQAQPPSERMHAGLHQATALLNLGNAELASLRSDEGRRHLEQALALARRIDRPYLEMKCLAHLALSAAHAGLPVEAARRPAEDSLAIAEARGWDGHHGAAAAVAVGGMTLTWLGRFADGERRLNRAQRAPADGRPPATEVLLHTARAVSCLAQHRAEDALAAVREAEAPSAELPSEHALCVDLRGRALRTQLATGADAAVRGALDEMPAALRSRPEIRLAAAALELADGRPERALDELVPVVDRATPAVYPVPTAIEALLLCASAHDQLGDARAVETSLEQALALAEPDGIVLPFALVPLPALLRRHRGHRTAHAALLSTILDMLGGGVVHPEAEPLREPLSDAELRVVRHLPSNLKAPEIASELCVSANTVRTHLRHIYAKLDAHSRGEAVKRARGLGLLAPDRLAA